MDSRELYTLLFVIVATGAAYWFGVWGLLAVVLIAAAIGFIPDV